MLIPPVPVRRQDGHRHLRAASLLAAAVLAFATACTSGTGIAATTSANTVEQSDITIAAVPSVDLAGVYIALDDGLFAKQGLRVKLVKIASSKAIITDQLAGKIDLCAGAYMPYISAEAAGGKFHILAEGSIMAPRTRVLLTPAGSRVMSVSDLAGKTIGLNATNSISTLLTSLVLEENGISPSKVRFVTDSGRLPHDGHGTPRRRVGRGRRQRALRHPGGRDLR